MNTKFYGALRVLKGVLPTMRANKSGTVVTMSSVFGLIAAPGGMAYNAANFALEALGETLATDLSPFNIRSVIIEPGLFRTSVMANARQPLAGRIREYADPVVDGALQFINDAASNPENIIPGDPNKLGKRVVEFVDGTGMAERLEKGKYLRLPLGKDGMEQTLAKMANLKKNLEALTQIAESTDFDGSQATGVSTQREGVGGGI
jgi:NAD(P)-dependent dehydrogenase (short-subunit alcohol dehydrogenase family)